MNRRILIQVTAPAILIGLLLLGACVAGAWYTNHLQKNLTTIRSESMISLRAAQQLEINLRQLRFHGFLYLIEPTPDLLARINGDQDGFETALASVKKVIHTSDEIGYVQQIEQGYQQYHDELAQLREDVRHGQRQSDLAKLVDAHPIRHVVKPCQDLLQVSQERMEETLQESDRVSRDAQWALLLLALGGPLGGLVCGYGIARGLSRSIYQLSVRVQDISQRLEQDVASLTVAADGDLHNLDRQLQQVVLRVEEVAERVQRHQREMLRAEQLSAVGQLAASVAHEVRNPLTSVKLLVEAALRGLSPKPLTHADLEVIHGEVVRLEHTVQSFLDFARLPAPRRRSVDLNKIMEQAVELIRTRARQQHVDIAVQAALVPLFADVDQSQMCTVLVNLLLNALDAMPNGGRLQLGLEDQGTELRVWVADTGPGISPEMSGRLFTPFSSTKPTGTGLGLSISRRIVEEHGGRITGCNRATGGAYFHITLPRMSQEREQGEGTVPGQPCSAGEIHANAVGR
jgi:signal transduction histidine kinase